tara:strand:- start:176 stop:349 length:174 start_codon:yes stop_codon:yes gene_type:complete
MDSESKPVGTQEIFLLTSGILAALFAFGVCRQNHVADAMTKSQFARLPRATVNVYGT